MLHRREPGIPVIGRAGAIELYPLRIHGRAKERHIVLPADHTTDLPQGCLKYWKSGAVAKPPDQPFHRCRHQFAVFSHQFTLRREKQNGTIEGPDIPFNHTDGQIHAVVLLQKLPIISVSGPGTSMALSQ